MSIGLERKIRGLAHFGVDVIKAVPYLLGPKDEAPMKRVALVQRLQQEKPDSCFSQIEHSLGITDRNPHHDK